MIETLIQMEIRRQALMLNARQLAICMAEERLTKAQRARRYNELVKALDDIHTLLVTSQSELETLIEGHYLADPQLCARCLHLLTMTEAQLRKYIDAVAKAASAARLWESEELCWTRLTAAMRPGDEITFIGIGLASLRRVDGTTVAVMQRDA